MKTSVTLEQAKMCAEFMIDNDEPTEGLPREFVDAFECYADSLANGAEALTLEAELARFRAALEAWLASDRTACVGLLGPGLGICACGFESDDANKMFDHSCNG